MPFTESAINPWGQDVLIGIDWSLFWIALVAGGVFLILHLGAAAPVDRRREEGGSKRT